MKTVLSYAKPYTPKIVLQMTLKVVGTLMDLVLPWILSHIIDDIVPLGSTRAVFLWGGVMILCAVAAVLTNVYSNRLAARTSNDIIEKLRHDLFEKAMHLSCTQVDTLSIPSLISRLTSDTYNINRMLLRVQRLGIRAPILLVGGIAVTLALEPHLAAILVCLLPFLSAAVWFISKKGAKLYGNVQLCADKLVRKIQEFISGIRVITALSKTDFEKQKFSEINGELGDTELHAGYVMSTTGPTMNLLLNLGLVAVVVAGGFLVNSGTTQPGKIIAFLSYFTIILNAVLSITRIFMLVSKGSASAKRVSQVLTLPTLQNEGDTTAQIAEKKSDCHVEFDDVTFSYREGQPVLKNVSFRVKHGETLGIIGATGSGKSTIISLLLRFYTPDSGNIFIDGTNINCIPSAKLYAMFGSVLQNDFLLAGSVKENIDFGRGLSDDSIHRAADVAQASFIDEKENAFDYALTIKGANFSGGQKQRLFLSRALAGNPEILLLDDVSGALDYATDAKLRRALRDSCPDTTTLTVSQRISSVMNAEQILVICDDGTSQCGSHEELLRSNEYYSQVFCVQMGGAANG